MSCGNQLERRCPNCGEPAPPEARFCMACGALEPQRLQRPAAPASGAAGGAPPGHRALRGPLRLHGGGRANGSRGSEDARGRRLRRLGQEVERYGGTVDKYIGDNVMALFGAGGAQDDAERAVRAGLGMQEAMGRGERKGSRGRDLRPARGVNTGEALAGAVGDGYTVVGDTVNVASRARPRPPPAASRWASARCVPPARRSVTRSWSRSS